jgi:hypothetical protein
VRERFSAAKPNLQAIFAVIAQALTGPPLTAVMWMVTTHALRCIYSTD